MKGNFRDRRRPRERTFEGVLFAAARSSARAALAAGADSSARAAAGAGAAGGGARLRFSRATNVPSRFAITSDVARANAIRMGLS